DPGRARRDRRGHRGRSAARVPRVLPARGRPGARRDGPLSRRLRAPLGDAARAAAPGAGAGRAQRRRVRGPLRARRAEPRGAGGDLMALPTDPELPLADVKVLDFSWVGVAPITVKYLADHGATVVRVESHARLDVVRLGPPWHEATPGIERSQFYAGWNTSKHGLALDLSRPAARDVARRLA